MTIETVYVVGEDVLCRHFIVLHKAFEHYGILVSSVDKVSMRTDIPDAKRLGCMLT